MIRFAKPDDCAAMLAIYAPYIETTITFEQEVPSREAFSLRIADVQRYGTVGVSWLTIPSAALIAK